MAFRQRASGTGGERSAFAPCGIVCLALAVSLLGGCSDRVLDHGLLGSLSDAPGDGPSPIRRMGESGAGFPNLASVPPRPKDFSTSAERRKDLDSLTRDRSRAQDLQKAAGIVPAPLDVPPPPKLTPGAP
jgi:hypothetical protein